MPTLVKALGLKGNPFEHYVAESEPDIAVYAVRPPYFETIDARAKSTSSYILFGDRGAGKSATRLTIFKELWKDKANGKAVPLAVNFTDFTAALNGGHINNASELTLVKEVAFVVIESLLTWLSSLEDDDRSVYLEALNEDEKSLCYNMLRDFYLSRSESKRHKSVREAMSLFNQALIAKSKLWLERRWDPITNLIGAISDILTRKLAGTKDSIAAEVTAVIGKTRDAQVDSVLMLRNLVELVAIFNFSGVVMLIDKVDETAATNNSVDKTAELIYPLLARVQLMEIERFSWVWFLWDRVKNSFEGEKYHVRLDKIGHATVSWSDEFFSLMLDKRLEFFSEGRLQLNGLFIAETNVDRVREQLMRISMRSPREMIRLMDVIIREHDVVHSAKNDSILLSDESIQVGIDNYVTDRISTIYGERLLAQIFRLNRTTFSNKDVQLTFRVGAQSARTRIQSWESAGIIKFSGTRAAEGPLGGKPANEYTIVDARIERIMHRQLVSYGVEVEPEELEADYGAVPDSAR